MIGISFYLNDSLAEERIVFAGKKGVKRAFTSLHIPEESGNLASRAIELLKVTKECGVDVYADVSHQTPAHMGLQKLQDLKELGVTGLRLDDFFEPHTILALSMDFKLALNASILMKEEVVQLLDAGLLPEQLIAWHNFYPRKETGLDEEFFHRQNQMFQQLDIPVSAYISGDGEKRGPLFEGLPTLEKHREIHPYAAAIELFQSGVEDVYIGDPGAGGQLLEQLVEYDDKKLVCLHLSDSCLKEGEYRLRPDFARDVLRLMNTRTTASVPPANTEARPKGSITMDNDRYGRYRGEVQITLHDLPADDRVNVIGHVLDQDLPLLPYISPGDSISIVVRGK
ncbi:MupG family TIM beta-alpha barrel fold protein [Mesobacillus foraminis]|uniref:MupG family TIM beta-alpha barrel fold protein n=1 Tax=Mesobacillus foraminis TaxID=279826 RepID=UPI0039A11B71